MAHHPLCLSWLQVITKPANLLSLTGAIQVAPWWEVSKEATELYLSYGIEYDHSMSHHDCQAYYLRTGDQWTKIDYSQPAKTWMHPLKPGSNTGMIEIPANWYLNDLPPLMFMKKVATSHGWVDVRSVEQL